MKLLIVTVLGLAACFCSAEQLSDSAILKEAAEDFKALIPKAKIGLIYAKHSVFDRQFRNAKNFLGTPKYQALGVKVMESKPFQDMIQDLKNSGIDGEGIINVFGKFLYLPPLPKNAPKPAIQHYSLNTFLDEVVAALPRGDISRMMKEKMRNSPQLRKMFDKITSAGFQRNIQNILNHPPLAPTFAAFRSNGIEFNKIMQVLNNILSWGR